MSRPHGTAYIDIYENCYPHKFGNMKRLATIKTNANGKTPASLQAASDDTARRHGLVPKGNWKKGSIPDNRAETYQRFCTDGHLLSLSYWIK